MSAWFENKVLWILILHKFHTYDFFNQKSYLVIIHGLLTFA
jgi:hypothetical protein